MSLNSNYFNIPFETPIYPFKNSSYVYKKHRITYIYSNKSLYSGCMIKVNQGMYNNIQSGLAHLFEHMIFELTPENKDFFELVKQYNGNYNGATSSYITSYYFKVMNKDKSTFEHILKLYFDMFVNVSALNYPDKVEGVINIVKNEINMLKFNVQNKLVDLIYLDDPKFVDSIIPLNNFDENTIKILKNFQNEFYKNIDILIFHNIDKNYEIPMFENLNKIFNPNVPIKQNNVKLPDLKKNIVKYINLLDHNNIKIVYNIPLNNNTKNIIPLFLTILDRYFREYLYINFKLEVSNEYFIELNISFITNDTYIIILYLQVLDLIKKFNEDEYKYFIFKQIIDALYSDPLLSSNKIENDLEQIVLNFRNEIPYIYEIPKINPEEAWNELMTYLDIHNSQIIINNPDKKYNTIYKDMNYDIISINNLLKDIYKNNEYQNENNFDFKKYLKNKDLKQFNDFDKEINRELNQFINPENKTNNKTELKTEIKTDNKTEFNPIINPKFNPEFNPIIKSEFNPEINPIIKSEFNPRFSPNIKQEINPGFNPNIKQEFNPRFNPNIKQEINPGFNPNIKPEINLEINPIINPEFNPEFKPIINSEINPIINPEFKPIINPIIKPEINPDFKPEFNPIINPEINQNKPNNSINYYLGGFNNVSTDNVSINNVSIDNYPKNMLFKSPIKLLKPYQIPNIQLNKRYEINNYAIEFKFNNIHYDYLLFLAFMEKVNNYFEDKYYGSIEEYSYNYNSLQLQIRDFSRDQEKNLKVILKYLYEYEYSIQEIQKYYIKQLNNISGILQNVKDSFVSIINTEYYKYTIFDVLKETKINPSKFKHHIDVNKIRYTKNTLQNIKMYLESILKYPYKNHIIIKEDIHLPLTRIFYTFDKNSMLVKQLAQKLLYEKNHIYHLMYRFIIVSYLNRIFFDIFRTQKQYSYVSYMGNNVYKDDNVIYYDINYAMIIDESKYNLEIIGSEINDFIYNTSIKYLQEITQEQINSFLNDFKVHYLDDSPFNQLQVKDKDIKELNKIQKITKYHIMKYYLKYISNKNNTNMNTFIFKHMNEKYKNLNSTFMI